jgi:hypothetical protein
MSRPTLRPTRVAILVGIASAVLGVTWSLARLAVRRGGVLPEVPWIVVGVLVLTAAGLLLAAWNVRRRPTDKLLAAPLFTAPLFTARLAVMAKAGSHTGAILTGLYLGYLLAWLPSVGSALGRSRVTQSGAAAGGALVLVIAGLLLEWLCRVPPSPPGDPEGVGGASSDPFPGKSGPERSSFITLRRELGSCRVKSSSARLVLVKNCVT